jgi:thioredoxin reductase (NADPH)
VKFSCKKWLYYLNYKNLKNNYMENRKNYDVIILGAGPAGLTAQLYALRYNLKALTIGGIVGGLMTQSHKICNWPGEPAIGGNELAQKILEQVKGMGGEVLLDEIESITKTDEGWVVNTRNKKSFTTKALVMAIGTNHNKLGLAEEASFVGKGLAYCATCDAMFFKGKVVAVVGGGNSATTSALYLADICSKVYLIYRGDELKGEGIWQKEINEKDNIVRIKNTQVTELLGEPKLNKVILDKPFEGSTELVVDGIFVEIGVKPKSELFVSLGGEIDETGHIKVKADQSTNLPGLWAAGDVTNGSNGFRQILTACAEGAIASNSIFSWLKKNKSK